MSSLPPFAMVIPLPEDARLRSVDVAVWYALSVSAHWEKDEGGRPYLGRCTCGMKKLCGLARCCKTALRGALERLEAVGAIYRTRPSGGKLGERSSYILAGGGTRDVPVRETYQGGTSDVPGGYAKRTGGVRETYQGGTRDVPGGVRETTHVQSINTNCYTESSTNNFLDFSHKRSIGLSAARPCAGETEKIDLQGGDENKASGEPDTAFETFWAAYPRKVQKQVALRAWRGALGSGANADDVQNAAAAYSDAMRKKRTPPDKVMYASTFLGVDERWRDWLPPDGASYREAMGAVDDDEPMTYEEAKRRYEAEPLMTYEEAVRLYGGKRLMTIDTEAREVR